MKRMQDKKIIDKNQLCIEKSIAAHNFLMMKTIKTETGMKIAKLCVVTAAVYLGMKYILPVVLPFLIALVLARLLYPLAIFLEKKGKVRKATARFLAYGVLLAMIGLLAVGLFYLCYRMGSSCLDHMDSFMESADRIFGSCCDKLEEFSGIGTEEIQNTIKREASELTGGAVAYSKDAGWFMAGLLAKLFVIFIASLLILNDYEQIMGGINKTWAGRYAIRMLLEIKSASGAYFRAQLFIMGVVTAICIGGLFLLQISHALWIGFAVGIFDALPFFGTGTIFVPWALVEVLFGRYKNALGFLVIYMICNFIRQILEPRLVGKKLGVPPLAVLMSIYIGIWVYGGTGVILGPLSALVIYEIYKNLN